MSNLPFIDIEYESRDAERLALESYLKGEVPISEIADKFADFNAFFSALSAAAKAADEKLKEPAGNPYLKRMRALLALATRRDAAYALASRRYMMLSGFNQKMRLHFEVQLNASDQLP